MATLSKGMLVTIIGEAVLQDRLIHLFTQLKVSGYTLIPAKGAAVMADAWAILRATTPILKSKPLFQPPFPIKSWKRSSRFRQPMP